MSEKLKQFLFNYFGYIMSFVTCLAYVLTAIFIIEPTGKGVWQIIGDGVLAFFVSVSTSHLLRVQGIINAMKDDMVVKTMTLYSATVIKISEVINKLKDWCHKKNLTTYKQERIKMLARCGLNYEDCFTEDGIAKPFIIQREILPIQKDEAKLKNKETKEIEKLRILNLEAINKNNKSDYKNKKKCYKNAINLKLTELHSNNLTSEGGKKNDPNYLGLTINEYIAVSAGRNIALGAVMAIVFGIYGISLIKSFDWVYLIWTGFQVCLFLIFGFIGMRMAYMFITTEYRGRIIKKIDNLEEFYADIKEDSPRGDNQNEYEHKKEISV